jgi:cyanophycinase
MIWSQITVGGGDSFGVLYFANSAGLAPKKVTDGDMGGSGLNDIRNGTQGLQYNYNGGKMPSFGLINFTVDTHFNARGRLGRIPSEMVNTNSRLGLGID